MNFHPSYRVYFYQDITGGNNFEEASIMPALNAGSKETYMSARSKDTTLAGYVSAMATPSVVLARELREPVPPGVPMGPLFATRPNFYGKATYTFDVQVDNPFSLIFYRANERKILDTLYKPETVALILQELASLDSPDALFFQDRWSDLVNLSIDGSYNFKEYVSGGVIPSNRLCCNFCISISICARFILNNFFRIEIIIKHFFEIVIKHPNYGMKIGHNKFSTRF